MGLQAQVLKASTSQEIDAAFATLARERSDALFVGNDSGPAHMAAAFGLPMVVIFGSSDVDVWRPWKTASEALQDPGGISSISTEQVISALARLRVHA